MSKRMLSLAAKTLLTKLSLADVCMFAKVQENEERNLGNEEDCIAAGQSCFSHFRIAANPPFLYGCVSSPVF